MTTARIFLDHNATTPLRPEAREALLAALDVAAAASSPHAEGRKAREIVETARANVAALVGCDPRRVVFTAGATEANATALTPHWHSQSSGRPLDRLLVSSVEHASVLKGGRFVDEAEALPVDELGRPAMAVWAERMAALRGDGERPLVSLMAANNETGVVEPVAEIAELVHAAGGILHCDAAQLAGKIPFSVAALGADLVTLSSHKLGGPFGAGALVVAREGLHLADPLLRGGGQERGLRSGTENIAAIAGFGAAAAVAAREMAREGTRQAVLRDRLEAALSARWPEIVVFGRGAARLPNTLAFAMPGIAAETALMALDLAGIALSSGSACSSGKVRPSHVLRAMGVAAPLVGCALRVSLGRTTTGEDIERFLAAWNVVVERIHERHGKARAA